MTTIDTLRKALEALDGLCETLSADFHPKEHEVRNAQQSSAALRAEIERLERLEGVEPNIQKLVVGALPTLNQDPYPALGDWWVQLWTGSGEDDKVLARAYGATPDEATQIAERIAFAMTTAPIAPSIPALSWDDVQKLEEEFGHDEVALSAAYALAAERAGVQIK